MPDEDKTVTALIAKAKDSPYVPDALSVLRAGISAIPVVGGALDHLVFDKAQEIRIRNIERTIAEINLKIDQIDSSKLDRGWFGSTECLNLFTELVDRVKFESSEGKIAALSAVYSVSGIESLSRDPNKFAVLDSVSKMTDEQRKILEVIGTLSPELRKFQGGGLEQSSTSIWYDQIAKASGSTLNVALQIDLEILQSLNLTKRTFLLVGDGLGYTLTVLGDRVCHYLRQ